MYKWQFVACPAQLNSASWRVITRSHNFVYLPHPYFCLVQIFPVRLSVLRFSEFHIRRVIIWCRLSFCVEVTRSHPISYIYKNEYSATSELWLHFAVYFYWWCRFVLCVRSFVRYQFGRCFLFFCLCSFALSHSRIKKISSRFHSLACDSFILRNGNDFVLTSPIGRTEKKTQKTLF